MAQRVELDLCREHLNGPFPTLDAIVNVGKESLTAMGRSGSVFWADHSKQNYIAFQEVMPHHVNNTPWCYKLPHPYDVCSVQYGRVKIFNYEDVFVLLDPYTKDSYASFDLNGAFDIAVGLVHYFPNQRMLPDVVNGKTVLLPTVLPTNAGLQPLSALEENGVWSGTTNIDNARAITLSLSDAVSILAGDKPSAKFLSDVAMTYPQALMAAYGHPIIAYSKRTTSLGVAQSISMLALAQDIAPADAYATFVVDRTVGKYHVVSGWGYKLMLGALPDINNVAAIDLALAHSSSPEHVEAIVNAMILDVPESDGASDLVYMPRRT